MFVLETDKVETSKIISMKENKTEIIENGNGFSEKLHIN